MLNPRKLGDMENVLGMPNLDAMEDEFGMPTDDSMPLFSNSHWDSLPWYKKLWFYLFG